MRRNEAKLGVVCRQLNIIYVTVTGGVGPQHQAGG